MNHRYHILGIPHTVTSKEFNACAYTQKVVKFGKMMTERGHEVLHYGHEDSNLPCTEHITVLTNEDFEKSYGSFSLHFISHALTLVFNFVQTAVHV